VTAVYRKLRPERHNYNIGEIDIFVHARSSRREKYQFDSEGLLDIFFQRAQAKRLDICREFVSRSSALAMKGVAPSYAWLARRALNTRPDWKQVSETVFIYI
jgi:hypothetical protein